ncbi:MAG: aldehyde dehydrogenase [Alphaproteobacteria bacterium HGW-Alphaproteobacteria-6]|nr:MAG: aldehyde dehydrogenase [Alphaproteobacteria bacterium HGW-Alphaproteobacteria-6]
MSQNQIDALRTAPLPAFKHIVDGRQVSASDGGTMAVVSPIDGAVLTTFDDGGWPDLPPASRKKILMKWADLIEANALEIAVLGVRENGTEIGMALKAEPLSAVATLRYYAEAIDKLHGEIAPTDPAFLGLVHREPVGVVGAIVPWNFPLMIGAWKFAPALAAGCTMVLKPAETASLTLLRVAELALEAGLPPGVFNVVTGEGAVVGARIAESMDVDVLVFTGSGGTGRRLLEAAARSNLKRVYLELGGKSPNIVFADAPDLDEAAKVAAHGIFRNSGQVCIAGSRILVERSIHATFVEKLAAHAATITVGDPLDSATQAGAVNSERQLLQNLAFVDEARALGRNVIGGTRIRQETGGYYMSPAIVADAAPEDRVFREEVFGPVVTVTTFDTEAEAVALANDTTYGLAAAVWTANLSRAHRMVRKIRAGLVHVNTYGGSDLTVPLGGVKQSGNGHDKSLHAFDKFLDLKTAWVKL